MTNIEEAENQIAECRALIVQAYELGCPIDGLLETYGAACRCLGTIETLERVHRHLQGWRGQERLPEVQQTVIQE